MIDVAKLPDAYKEVYTILEYMDFEDVKLISKEFIDMLRNNMNPNHYFSYNPEIEFEKQGMLRETKAVFAYIYLNFWADDERQKVINAKFKQDILKKEQEKQLNYSTDNIFKNRQEPSKDNTKIIVVNNEKTGVIKRLLIKIKTWFKRK